MNHRLKYLLLAITFIGNFKSQSSYAGLEKNPLTDCVNSFRNVKRLYTLRNALPKDVRNSLITLSKTSQELDSLRIRSRAALNPLPLYVKRNQKYKEYQAQNNKSTTLLAEQILPEKMDDLERLVNMIRSSGVFTTQEMAYVSKTGAVLGGGIGLFVGHKISPWVMKRVSQLACFNDLSPTRKQQIKTFLPWGIRIISTLLGAAVTYKAIYAQLTQSECLVEIFNEEICEWKERQKGNIK